MTFILTGKMVSGKNQIQISSRNGRIFKYPNKRFTQWRDEAVKQLTQQFLPRHRAFEGRVRMTVRYTPGDLIRRDLTGMLDALFHLLEHVGIVENDHQIRCLDWHDEPMQRNKGQVAMQLEEAPHVEED